MDMPKKLTVAKNSLMNRNSNMNSFRNVFKTLNVFLHNRINCIISDVEIIKRVN